MALDGGRSALDATYKVRDPSDGSVREVEIPTRLTSYSRLKRPEAVREQHSGSHYGPDPKHGEFHRAGPERGALHKGTN